MRWPHRILYLVDNRSGYWWQGGRWMKELDRTKPVSSHANAAIFTKAIRVARKCPGEVHKSWMQSYFKMGWVYGEKYSRDKKTHPHLVQVKTT